MKNRIKKNYSIEAVLAALIITGFINQIIKKFGLPILILLLSVFFFHSLNGKNAEQQKNPPKTEQVHRDIP